MLVLYHNLYAKRFLSIETFLVCLVCSSLLLPTHAFAFWQYAYKRISEENNVKSKEFFEI